LFQIFTLWNLFSKRKNDREQFSNIKRGYDEESFLSGQFVVRLKNGTRPLSVSDITDRYCKTRRDLYYKKGLTRPSRRLQKENWMSKAGSFVDNYFEFMCNNITKTNPINIDKIIECADKMYSKYICKKREKIKKLEKLEQNHFNFSIGDTSWLISTLKSVTRAEIAYKTLDSILNNKNSKKLKKNMIQTKRNLKPKLHRIGINKPAQPDFIIPEKGIIGDVKTGHSFKDHYLLTCTAYALAYENEMGPGHDIDWGVIYFFPTFIPSNYVKPYTFVQIYIFPITLNLRDWFLEIRDDAYEIISRPEPPPFPKQKDRGDCINCKFREYCKENGLDISD